MNVVSALSARCNAMFSLVAATLLMAFFALVSPVAAQAALPEWAPQMNENMIVIGGTDDPTAKDQLGRMDGWTDDSTVSVVDYPAGFSPAVGDTTYDDSVKIGKQNLRKEIDDTDGSMTIVGMSQSARIVGDVVGEYDSAENADDMNAVLMADPRFPKTGLESVLAGSSALGATATGERQPTEHVEVTSVCIEGDPVCDFGGSPLNIAPGFFCIHSGNCGDESTANYGHLDELEVEETWQEGQTTYVVLDAPHPWRIAAEAAGVPVTDQQEEILHTTMPVGGGYQSW